MPEDVEEGGEAGDMGETKVAIPCIGEAHLQALVSPHFGRCDSYAIVTLEQGKIKATEPLSNSGHSDCASPVQALADKGVRLMLVTGMGLRPYLTFKQLGIEVRYGVRGTVADAIESYLKGESFPMTDDSLCNCHPNE
jgi:predicted Fe-Mo cluster-binding NifX family protein